LGESWFEDSQAKKFVRHQLNDKKLSSIIYTHHPIYFRELKIGESWSRPALAKSETLSPK
jgi:hypothetical protein